jgi:hypothetical protein
MTDKLTDTSTGIDIYQTLKDSHLPIILDIDKTQELVDSMLVRGSIVMYEIMTNDEEKSETKIKADTAILKYADHLEKRLNKPKDDGDLLDDM